MGDNIFLRDIQLADVTDAYHRWMADAEITRYLESRFHAPSCEDLKRYVEANLADPDTYLFAVCDKTSTRHIGNVKLGPINRVHGRASIGHWSCW